MNSIRLFLLTLFFLSLNGSSKSASNDLCKMSHDLISGINKALGYLEENYKQINLDGWFGYELLREFIERIELSPKNDKCGIAADINATYQRILNINHLALQRVKFLEPTYLKRVIHAVNKLFAFKPKWQILKKSSNNIPNTHSVQRQYQEDDGDACYNELAGESCHISDKCSKMFLDNINAKEYVATHIAMYLIIYKEMKCYANPGSPFTKASLDKRINAVCSGVLQENINLLKKSSSVIAKDLDIFLERIVICGGKLGFVEFFSNHAFDVVLNSQDVRDGCIRVDAFVKNLKYLTQERRSNELNMRVMLSKRRDRAMKNGCSSHLLGLGAAGYGIFLHYVLSDNTPQ